MVLKAHIRHPRQAVVSLICCLVIVISVRVNAEDGLTSLTNPDVLYHVTDDHHLTLRRDNLTAIVVDNAAVDLPQLPQHRAGYNGVASLTHSQRQENLFVPGIAGLNFEHIHDGTKEGLVEKFEPRKFPMQLRVIDKHTVEVYQAPTGTWKLESCGRYQLLADNVIEYTFECIPRSNDYRHNFIGLFWASYIHQPQDKSIFFHGRLAGSDQQPQLINAITPSHGVHSTHRPTSTSELPPVEPDFPLTLVNHPSPYEYTAPWYFGVSHGMAFVQMFRSSDQIWLAQSPSGGGNGNPAWDFQWFIDDPVVDRPYQFVMRTAYIPYESPEQIRTFVLQHGFR